MTLIKKLDNISEELQNLYADAIEEGFDDEATCIEDVLEILQTLKFVEPEQENANEAA